MQDTVVSKEYITDEIIRMTTKDLKKRMAEDEVFDSKVKWVIRQEYKKLKTIDGVVKKLYLTYYFVDNLIPLDLKESVRKEQKENRKEFYSRKNSIDEIYKKYNTTDDTEIMERMYNEEYTVIKIAKVLKYNISDVLTILRKKGYIAYRLSKSTTERAVKESLHDYVMSPYKKLSDITKDKGITCEYLRILMGTDFMLYEKKRVERKKKLKVAVRKYIESGVPKDKIAEHLSIPLDIVKVEYINMIREKEQYGLN